MNLIQRQFSDDKDSPGSGAGIAGNPQPRELEQQAARKVAGAPGSPANAAGMAGDKDGSGGTGTGSDADPRPDRGDNSPAADEASAAE